MIDLEATYRTMALARRLDERMWRLARSGRAHFAVPSSGQRGRTREMTGKAEATGRADRRSAGATREGRG